MNIIKTKAITIALLFVCTALQSQTNHVGAVYKKFSKKMIEPNSLVFFILGDFGRNGQLFQTSVAEALIKCAKVAKPDFILTVGDNFYEKGVKDGNDPQFKSSFENVYGKLAKKVDWYPVLGNHDYMGNTQGEIDYSKINPHWKMPGRYYTFQQTIDSGKKTVRFIMIDTNPFLNYYRSQPQVYPDLLQQDTARQLHFIDSVLQASSADTWKIVVGHHPVYSSNERGDSKELRMLFKPRLEQYGVQLYVCGHDHNLQHLRRPENQLDYFVSGAGSDTSHVYSGKYNLYGKKAPGFMIVTIKRNTLHAYFVDMNEMVLYEYTRESDK